MKAYLGLLLTVTLAGAAPTVKSKLFKDQKKKVRIELPADWHIRSSDDGKVKQISISAQEIKSEKDLFSTGVTITKIRNVSRSFAKVNSEEKIISFWKTLNRGAAREMYRNKDLSQNDYRVGKFKGYLMESVFQVSRRIPPIHVYRVVLAHNDTLYSLTLECPESDWKETKPLFDKALASLRLQ